MTNELLARIGLLEKENQELKDLIDTILNFSFFKEECPLNFGFENNTNEDKSQSVFYEDEWCENNCNDNYKNCWLKYFEKLKELEKDYTIMSLEKMENNLYSEEELNNYIDLIKEHFYVDGIINCPYIEGNNIVDTLILIPKTELINF